MHVAERIRRLLGIDDAGEYFEVYVQRTNANLAQYAGIAVAIIELMLFINAMVHKGDYDSATNRMNRAHAISFLVFAAISLLLSLLARHLIKQDRVRDMMVPVSIYVYLAVGYGIFNSYIDSLHGEPPLTFIFAAMASACVFVMPPLGTIMLTSISFIAFNQLTHFSTIFSNSTVFHYWIGWMIVTFVSILRYHECRYGSRHEEALHVASELDGLTGLRNRRSLRMDFPRFVGGDTCVVMCDLDDFKGINDAYGHEAGDEVIKAFADALNAVFVDASCYRYGGDEYLVVAAGEDPTEFRALLGTVRDRYEEQVRSSHAFAKVPGASIGYAYGHATTSEELRELVRLADVSLYEVKRSGKGEISGKALPIAVSEG